LTRCLAFRNLHLRNFISMFLLPIAIVAHTETHKMAWEVLKRTKEVNQLQQALGDFQAAVFEERKKTLAIVAENDALKSKGISRVFVGIFGSEEGWNILKQSLEQTDST
jgi:hypothetical protein